MFARSPKTDAVGICVISVAQMNKSIRLDKPLPRFTIWVWRKIFAWQALIWEYQASFGDELKFWFDKSSSNLTNLKFQRYFMTETMRMKEKERKLELRTDVRDGIKAIHHAGMMMILISISA